MTLRSSRLKKVVALAAMLLLPQCTLLYGADAKQCTTDGDCSSRGPAFEGTFCHAERHTCERSTDYCTSNKACIQRNFGQPFICHQDTHRCAPVLNEFCRKVFGNPSDAESDDAVWIGEVPTSSVHPGYLGARNAMELAFRELSSAGLPGSSAAKRPFAVVECDSPPGQPANWDTASWDTMLRHLIDDVRVAGIVGGGVGDLLSQALRTSIAAKTPLISLTDQVISTADTPGRKGLYYRLNLPADLFMQQSCATVESYFEPRLKGGASPIVPSGTPMRVAFVGDPSTALSLNEAALNHIRFNDASVTENFANKNFKQFAAADPQSPEAVAQDAELVNQLLAYTPHLVISASLDGKGVALLEKNWPSGVKRPMYLASGGTLIPETFGALAADPSLADRLLVFLPGVAANSTAFLNLKLKYDAHPEFANDTKALVSGVGLVNAWDAMYSYYYAVASLAAVGADITPEAVGHAIRAVNDPQGTPIAPGPNSINTALGILGQQGTIRYMGTAGPILFDERGDNTNGVVNFACITLDPTAPIKPSAIFVDENRKIAGGLDPKCL
jgi:hypothetical protein